MSKKALVKGFEIFTARGRSKILSNKIVEEGGRPIQALDCHNYIVRSLGHARTLVNSDPKGGWDLLADLYKYMISEPCRREYANFWSNVEAEREYKALKEEVEEAYIAAGVAWMPNSPKLSDRVKAIPYTHNIKCSFGKHCVARLVSDEREGSKGHCLQITPLQGGVSQVQVVKALPEIARICNFKYPEIVAEGKTILVQEDLNLASMIRKAKSAKPTDRLTSICLAAQIKDHENTLCIADVVDMSDPRKGVRIRSVKSTITLSDVKTKHDQICAHLGYKKASIESKNKYILVKEDRTRIDAVKDAESISPTKKVRGLCANLEITDALEEHCNAVWFESGVSEVIKITSDNGYLKKREIEPHLEDILDYMGWTHASLEQEGGSVNVVKDVVAEALPELAISNEKLDRISAIPYHFALTDVAGDELLASFNSEAKYIHLISSTSRAVPFNKICNLMEDFEDYLGWKNLQATRLRGSVILYDDTCKEPSVYIPASVTIDDVLSHKTQEIAYGISLGNQTECVNLDDFKNVLIVGTQGSGKSTFMMNLTYQLARNNPSEIEEFCCIDLKNKATFAPLEGMKRFTVAGDPEQTMTMIDYVKSEVERRNTLATEEESHDGTYQGGYLFFLIEEYSLIKDLLPSNRVGEMRGKIEYILKVGRSAKVRVIAGLQRADQSSIDKGTKDQFSNYFLFRVIDKGYADNLFDGAEMLAEKGWRPITLRAGRCIVQLAGKSDIFQMQTPLIYNEDFRNLMDLLPTT